MRNGFLLLLVILVFAGVGFGDGLTFTFWDLQFFCSEWLEDDSWADLTGDGRVDMQDFGVLSRSWLRCMGDAGVAAREGYRRVDAVLGGVEIPGVTLPEDRFEAVVEAASAVIPLGVENAVDLGEGRSFWATLEALENSYIELSVVGMADGAEVEITVYYSLGVRQETVFDYGIATRGPLQLSGNIAIDGTNISIESDVYIESENSNIALSIIGNSQIGGEVFIVNPDAEVLLEGPRAGIGGEYGAAAIANHVFTGVKAVEFPVPNADHFEQYVGDTTIDSDTDLSRITSFDNVRIAADTNPYFSSNTQINGIFFIETPNIVSFAGSCDITGIIVGDGDLSDDSSMNQIVFLGPITSNPVWELPADSQHDGLRDEAGTFLMAPGFVVAFGSSFDTLHGAIAANGLIFFGNADGTIAGSLINYSDVPMTISGNGDITLNRSGIQEVPAGFEPSIILHRDDRSYCEICRVP